MRIYRLTILALLLLTTALLLGCQHRLAPKVYQVQGEQSIYLSGNETYCFPGAVINDSPNRDPLQKGDKSVLVVKRFYRDSTDMIMQGGLMTAEKDIEYRIFMELPRFVKQETVELDSKSICRIIGLYDLPEEKLRYYCRDGFIEIDTAHSKRFTGYFEAKYFNSENDSLILNGRINSKVKKFKL